MMIETLSIIGLILIICSLIEYLIIRKKEKAKLEKLDYYIEAFKEKYNL